MVVLLAKAGALRSAGAGKGNIYHTTPRYLFFCLYERFTVNRIY